MINKVVKFLSKIVDHAQMNSVLIRFRIIADNTRIELEYYNTYITRKVELLISGIGQDGNIDLDILQKIYRAIESIKYLGVKYD